ncbi:cilia- and flagella-associated protein 46-like [Solea solea]|uniref:cilia- and flagella-associated protein 46-like n=1 Tax=Solea solea TaxID=90069 RepID=UPI0027299EC7|nr:cilia- and flagella-associated protein 46-like [Solea solea]
MENDIRHFLTKATEQEDCEALQSAYDLIKNLAPHIVPELYVLCAEAALELHCLEISTLCLEKYFEGNPQANQILCRAYLCQGRLKSPPAYGNVKAFEEAIEYFLQAIEIAKNEPRCHFLVFNASVLYFHMVHPLLLPGRCLYLVPSLGKVVQALEQVANKDHSWRAELTLHLITCLVDSGRKREAAEIAKDIEEFIKAHTPHLFSRLFKLQVQHSLTDSFTINRTIKQDTASAVIYKIQELKTLEKEGNLTKHDSTKLEEMFSLLVGGTKTSTVPVIRNALPIQTADRVAFLLELALLSLQAKYPNVAANCLKELKLVEEVSIVQSILMKCVKAELHLLKKEANINDYSKASVEHRLKDIGKLDQLLQSAVREGDPQAVQAVCATQWKFCLPLLQYTLRKYIKTPLLRVAQELEDVQSILLEMRCQIHSELAKITEEEGCLEASLTHLQKAILLDDGTRHEQLSSALHLLQVRRTPFQALSQNKDKAAMLLQQTRGKQPHNSDIRPTLVAVGLHLGQEDFQMVLDGDNISKIPVDIRGSGPVAQLSARAQHHSASLQRLDSHLAKQARGADRKERMKLWASLAKTARKHEVWDVCRGACRFCLFYDKRWKISKAQDKSCDECLNDCNNRSVTDCLRILAETYFISAEATIQKLLTEGVQLYSPAVLPQKPGGASKKNPHWVIYSNWVQDLSEHATSNFLRAAELGMEIMEPWVVTNAAIYLWNYSSNLLVAGECQHLLPSFQSLLEMLQKLESPGNCALVVLLCNAVAQGLMKSVRGPEGDEPNLPVNEGKSSSVKRMKNTAALQDIYRALELCDYALQLPNCNMPGEMVSIAAKKQLVATWVQIKMLLQQQIDLKNYFKDERMNEEILMRVLVAVEMHQCNRTPRQMEFSAPSLTTLVTMASECSWTDAVVELHVWCQLASLCYSAKDHGLVLCCTESALQLEEMAEKQINTLPCVLYDMIAVNEMLSSAACSRGLSLVHESKGDLQTYREAMKFILSSISYAEKANNPDLCLTAARHYWNTCLPLIQTPEERWTLKDDLEKILTALFHTTTKHEEKEIKEKESLILTGLYFGSSKQEVRNEEGLTLRAAIYSSLLHIYIDESDRKSALQLLDKAINNIPSTRQALSLLKHCIKVKARLGESVLTDMQRVRDDEQCSSLMWHQLALCATNMSHKVTYYQKSISSLFSTETQWQKVDLILEFGQWLYFHNFPEASAQHQVQWAIDILLHLDPEPEPDPELDTELDPEQNPEQESTQSSLNTQDISLVGAQSLLFRQNMSSLDEVRHLDGLVRAHTLLAVMAGRTSPEHQLNLVIAYTFVLQIWQVSLEAASMLLQPQPPPTSLKKKKKSAKGKTPQHKKAKSVMSPPSCPEDWAKYICPDEVRDIFKGNSNPQCINTHSITNQTQSIFYLNVLEKELHSISLDHLTLPVLHLAELIAHDLTDKRSLSDLYRLKILWTCYELGLETHSQYQIILQDLCETKDEEQITCHTAIARSNNRRDPHKPCNQKAERDDNAWPGQQSMNVFAQDIWLDKAEVCLSMGLYQPARQLLAETHLVARELGNQKALARSLLSLATLACEEQKPAQALTLLDKTQDLSGDEEFWYQFTLIKVRALVGQRHQDVQTKIDHVIKQGCGALKLVMEQQINRAPEITFLITSLEMRGAKECIGTLHSEPGMTLCYENVQRVMAACSTLRECVSSFTKLNHRQQAAEASAESAHGMRLLANRAITKEEKQRFLLAGLSQLQQAVVLQEHVVLNAQSLLPQQKTCEFSLTAMWRLMHLRLALADFSLAMLEELCAEETHQALSRQRKTSTEIILEEFLSSTLEPNPIEQEWMNVSSTLGQVALCQLGAVSSCSLNNMETQARCLCLMGKYLRLQAMQMDPIYVSDLWDKRKHREALSDHETTSVQSENSENGKDKESNPKDPKTTVKSTELMQRRYKTKHLLAQATKALSEAVSLFLQHNPSSSMLADASINILGCLGQMEPAMAGQYLALFQSCCTVSLTNEVLRSACVDTNVSQLSALYSLHKNLLHYQGKRPSSMLKGLEDSLNHLSKAFSQLTINPNHFNILKELPSNLKILLLQHSEDGSELYGAFYEMSKTSENKAKTNGVPDTLTCSNLAKVPVCPQDLLTLREQIQTFGQDTRCSLIKEVCLHCTKGNLEAFEKHQKSATDKRLTPHFCKIVQDMEDYLKPLLAQFNFSCLRPQVEIESPIETTKSKDKKKKQNLPKPIPYPGEYVVLLADRKLLDLPLESLPFLLEEGVISVSRDLSLQLLHSRLNKVKPESVQCDNEKKTKSGKKSKSKKKEKENQSSKAIPDLPSNTFSVDFRNVKYIADSYNGGKFETSLTTKMMEIMDTSKVSKLQKDDFMGSLSELERLLCKCSAFIYLGKEHFMANISPGKLAALQLSKCRMALLFEQVHNDASSLQQSVHDTHTSAGQFPQLKTQETALLLSLCGVGCIVVNQWQSSFQQTANNMVTLLDNLVRVRQTCGQTIHALRRNGSKMMHKATGSHDPLRLTDSKKVDVPNKITLKPSSFNCVLYGLPYLTFT